MSLAQPAAFDPLEDIRGEAKEAHRVGHRRAALPDSFGNRFLSQTELIREPLVGTGGLGGVEIFSLKIFD